MTNKRKLKKFKMFQKDTQIRDAGLYHKFIRAKKMYSELSNIDIEYISAM